MFSRNQFSSSYVLLAALILLCTGCAKKYQKITLPPLKKAHFEEKKENITLKLRELNEQELKTIDSKGLGTYKIGSIPFDKKQNKRARNKYVRVLYGTLINESKHPITFNRKSVSLPVLPPHKAYGFSNKKMFWHFLGGVCGLLVTAGGITLLFTPNSGCGGLYMAGGFVIAAAASNLPIGIFFTVLGLEMTIAGFTIGGQEVAKENYLKDFAKDTMLSDKDRVLPSEQNTSWLMVVRSHKYKRNFTFNCNTLDGMPVVFDVHMPSHEAF